MSHLSSTPLIARAILLAGVLLAILALLSPSHFPAYAQGIDMDAIEYPENGTHTVAAYTAMDADGENITWSLTGDDMGDFTIEGGVLMFENTPDYENPADANTDNEYIVIVNANDGTSDLTMVPVTVTVTNVEEDGEVTLSTSQPKQAVAITAKLTDDDGSISENRSTRNPLDKVFAASGIIMPKWQWETSDSSSGPWEDVKVKVQEDGTPDPDVPDIENGVSATYEPRASDVDMYLRATVTYVDGSGGDDPFTDGVNESIEKASEISSNPVLMADYMNEVPKWPDQDPDTPAPETDQTREVSEGAEPGNPVGDPVVASDIGADGSQETLFYSLEDDDTDPGLDDEFFTINSSTGQISVDDDAMLDFEGTSQQYKVIVMATDPGSLNTPVNVTIDVLNVDESPVMAEPTLLVGLTTKKIAEINSFDPNGSFDEAVSTYTATDQEDDDATLKWSLSGTHSRKFELDPSTGATVNLSLKEDADYENLGLSGNNKKYSVRLTVTDGGNNSDSRDVVVEITNVEETGTIAILNRQPEVGTALRATATDPDGVVGSITWQWATSTSTSASANDWTDIAAGATSSSYTPQESDATNGNLYLRVTATYVDRYGAARKMLQKVSDNPVKERDDVNQSPRFTERSPKYTLVEGTQIPNNGEVLGTLEVTDDVDTDVGADVLTYTKDGSDEEFFTIRESGNGVEVSLKANTDLDYEAKKSYTFRVTATDPSNRSDTVTVTLSVDNNDEAPVFTAPPSSVDYAENGSGSVGRKFDAKDPEGASLQWTLDGTDKDTFSIDGGVLKFKNSPDFEARADANGDNDYEVTVQVSDGSLPSETPLIVTVTNVEEPGTVELSRPQPKVGVPIVATLTDLDEVVTGSDTWQWARSSNVGGPWTDIEGDTTSTPPIISDRATYTPGPDDVGYYLQATATYRDGSVIVNDPATEVDEREDTASMVSAKRVLRADYMNEAPKWPDQNPDTPDVPTPQTKKLREDAEPGDPVGAPVVATDIGSDGSQETLRYELEAGATGIDNTFFDINSMSGQISVGNAAMLDYEGDRQVYSVKVKAIDPSNDSNTVDVSIEILNVNESPEIGKEDDTDDKNLAAKTVDETGPNANRYIALYEATDDEEDNVQLKWSLAGADSDKFNFYADVQCSGEPIARPTGASTQLCFASQPDYEARADANRDNVYNVTVTVTDSDGNTTSRDVAVTVTNVEEDGKVTLSNRQPEVGVPIRAMLTDPDGGVRDVTWQWDYGDGSADIKDATTDTYTPVTTEATNTLTLRAKAKYRDAASENDPFTADDESLVILMGTDSPSVIAAVSNNQAPVFPDQDDDTPGDQSDRATRYVHENTKPNSAANPVDTDDPPNLAGNVGAPVAAMDSNTEHLDKLTYTLGGADVGAFTIDSGTGQIVVGEATELDYETKTSYTVRVTATDPSGASDTIIVTIMLRNVDEMPVVMKSGLGITGDNNIDRDEDDASDVATYTAAGQAAPGATWSLGGADADDFSISSSGVLTFRSTPDFEDPTDQGRNNVYDVMVKATSGAIEASLPVTVTVGNLEEDGTVTLSSDRNEIKVDVTITAEVTDIDVVTPNTVTWQWASSANAIGPYTNIPGATAEAYTPAEADVGNYLRATASYEDGHGPNKSESAATASEVLAATTDVIGTNGIVTLSPAQPVVGEAVTASLTDPDGGVTDMSWQWARASSPTASGTPITGATSTSYTPVQADVGSHLRATASYTDAQGPGQSASETTNAVNAATTTPIHRFDSNGDGSIQRDEVIGAIRAFLFEKTATRAEVLEVIRLNLFG